MPFILSGSIKESSICALGADVTDLPPPHFKLCYFIIEKVLVGPLCFWSAQREGPDLEACAPLM